MRNKGTASIPVEWDGYQPIQHAFLLTFRHLLLGLDALDSNYVCHNGMTLLHVTAMWTQIGSPLQASYWMWAAHSSTSLVSVGIHAWNQLHK
jgi:hypothetical protein